MRHTNSRALKEDWQAWHCGFSESVAYRGPDGAEVFAFSLPMDARHLAFLNGRCGDPRKRRNSLQSDWVFTKEWWFRTKFSVPAPRGGQRVFLRCRGVDYLAEYFVNATHVGHGESFNQVDYFDITAALVPGEQELAIRLWACDPRKIDREKLEKGMPASAAEARGLVKYDNDTLKARMFWGGDHNPFMLSCGIAMPPEVIVAENVLVESVRTDYALAHDLRAVDGRIAFNVLSWGAAEFEVTLTPRNFDGPAHRFTGSCRAGQTLAEVPFRIDGVRTWNPFHLGDPHCYELAAKAGGQEVAVTTGFRRFERRHNEFYKSSPAASVMDWHPYENNKSYGTAWYKGYEAIREACERRPDKPREGDYCHVHIVNGREIFIMGGAVVPTTLFLSDWSGNYLRSLVRRARESNNNTLRVWGGGYLLGEELFEEADLQGVMIVQDFLSFVRFTDKSQAQLRLREKEFRNVIRQLGPHPSVVAMNGGNELLQIGNYPRDPVFECMGRVMAQESGNQFYSLSSPVNPDVHGPWHFSLDHAALYRSFRAIFCSECGVMGAPAIKSLRKALGKAEIDDVFGEVWHHRQPHRPFMRNLESESRLFGPTAEASAVDFVQRTQLVQAMGYQYLVEEFRRQKPETSGFTTWEYNEPWLDFNWGILDNFLVPKHSFWTWKRSCASNLVSARFGSFVYAAGSRFAADVFFSAEGGGRRGVEATATAFDAAGQVLAQQHCGGGTDSASVMIGRIEFDVPERGAFFLRLAGRASDGGEVRNDYCFCAMPRAAREPVPVLFLSGGCYENAVSHEFFRAAGLEIDSRAASPAEPLDAASIELSRYRAVVIGPIFNPLTSLGNAFVARLRTAVQHGLGLAYFAYNTSAYLRGRYDVDRLQGSALEEMLPVRFAEDCYRNSEDYAPADTVLRKQREHAIWTHISMAEAPALGVFTGTLPKDEHSVIGTANGEPVLAAHKLGKGIVASFAGPYGGHNYTGMDFRCWPYAQRLLANIIEFTATGTVAPRPLDLHVLRPLLDVPPCEPEVDIAETYLSAVRREWEATVRNPGPVPLLYFDLGNDSELEGETFDWHVSDNRFILFEGESRKLAASAVARPGATLPRELKPVWSAWNA